jgi:hypothetical protein
MTEHEARQINRGRLLAWGETLSRECATAQVVFGISHGGKNLGVPVIIRTKEGPPDRDLYLLCRAALEAWAERLTTTKENPQ